MLRSVHGFAGYSADVNRAAKRSPWWTVTAMAFPLLILTLDFFGVTVALPDIGRDLGGSTGTLEWTVNAYLLAFSAPLIALGRLADIVGRRKIVLAGTVIFAAASTACALAPTLGFLIAARVVQGVGASMLYGTSLSIVSYAFTKERRGVGIGVWTGIGTIGQSIGPLIAGVFTTSLDWRWFFVVNVPLAIAGVVFTLMFVEESTDPEAERVDWPGFVAITAALVMATFAFQTASNEGFAVLASWLPLILGVALGGAFVLLERRSRDPLVDFTLFRTREYAGAAVVAWTGNWVFSAMMFFVTLYVQYALDYSALAAGAVFLAYTVPFAAMGPVSGKVFEKWGATWPMFVGMVIVAASCVPLVLSDANTGLGLVVTALGVTAIGQGLAYNISTTAAMNAVTDDKAGLASGVISAIRMVALVFGIAVSGFVFKVFETDGYDNAVAAAGGQLSSADKSEIQGLLAGSDEAAQKLTELSPATADQVEGIVRVAFTDGLSAAFILNFVVAVIGVAGALLGRKRHVPEKPDETDDSSGVMIRSPYHSIPIARTADMTIGT